MGEMQRVLVVGAGGPLGKAILGQLAAGGLAATAAYRSPHPGIEARLAASGATPLRLDLHDRDALSRALAGHDAAIFTPILTASAVAAPLLRPHHRAVFFSSNNVAVAPQEPLYAELARAEARVRQAAPQVTILRPTMIYGHPGDRNISRLMRAARRWPLLVRPAGAIPQQPVFYRDLAKAAVSTLLDAGTAGATIAVAGPDTVTLAALFRAVSRATGRRHAILPVPVSLCLRALPLLRRLNLPVPVSEHQLHRARLDKTARGANAIITQTHLDEGLRTLAEALAKA